VVNIHNRFMLVAHLKERQKYPAPKADLVKNCYDLPNLELEDKIWFEESLREREYASAGEVIETLGW